MIYFIQEDGADGFIKIGRAENVAKRLSELQVASARQLTCLGAIKGDAAEERALHHQFFDLRVRGEWFRPGKALTDFIATIDTFGTERKQIRSIVPRMPREDRLVLIAAALAHLPDVEQRRVLDACGDQGISTIAHMTVESLREHKRRRDIAKGAE